MLDRTLIIDIIQARFDYKVLVLLGYESMLCYLITIYDQVSFRLCNILYMKNLYDLIVPIIMLIDSTKIKAETLHYH